MIPDVVVVVAAAAADNVDEDDDSCTVAARVARARVKRVLAAARQDWTAQRWRQGRQSKVLLLVQAGPASEWTACGATIPR